MAYVKVDTAILTSSLWQDHDACRMFLAALLLARPHHATAPMAEVGLGTLDETGVILEPGWYGLVEASAPGLIAISGLSPARGRAALTRLNGVDADSRSTTLAGRRLLRVDGGFIIPNYMAYRDKDHTAASRMKDYRARQKAKRANVSRKNQTVTRNNRNVTSPVTQALALAIADQDQEQYLGLNVDQASVSTSSQESADRARASETAAVVPVQHNAATHGWVVPHGNPHSRPTNLVNGSELRVHAGHEWCSRERPSLCVLPKQHREIMGALQRSDAETREFYAKVIAKYDGQPIGDSRFKFWENEVAAEVGTVTAPPRSFQTKGNASVDAARRVARELCPQAFAKLARRVQ